MFCKLAAGRHAIEKSIACGLMQFTYSIAVCWVLLVCRYVEDSLFVVQYRDLELERRELQVAFSEAQLQLSQLREEKAQIHKW